MKKNCQCGTTVSGCPTGKLCRPRYFPRKLITDAEMTLEQDYFRDRLRLHNRMLHGWGVVCGARVCYATSVDEGGTTTTEAWKVKVERGYVLGPYGDEIVIDADVTIDLRTTQPCVADTDVPLDYARDPWCTRPPTCEEAGTFYLAVKYRDTLSHPVRVQPVGCGCDENSCEYARSCDGYELCLLTECPDSHLNPPGPPQAGTWGAGPAPACPPCPEDPWVVLGMIDVDDDGTVTISECECRRQVLGLGHLWWTCTQIQAPTDTDDVDEVPAPGESGPDIPVEVHTSGDKPGKPTKPKKPSKPQKLVVGGGQIALPKAAGKKKGGKAGGG